MKRVAIIGAGISGLAAAYYVEKYAAQQKIPIEVTLIERERRLGGTIFTKQEDGFIIEGGPDCFLSEKPWAAALAREIGIGSRIEGTNEENKGTFILSRGKLYPLPEGVMLMVPTRIMPMVTTGLISWPGKIRMGFDLFVPRRKDDHEETLAEFVNRRLGKEALDKIAEPLVAGVHAGVPETMSLRASFPRFKQLEDEYGSLIRGMIARMKQYHSVQKQNPSALTMFATFRDGLGELVRSIGSLLKAEQIKTGASATSVMRKTAGGWIISIVDGPMIEADGVICATPSYITANLLGTTDHELADELRAIPYVSTATVSMAFDANTLPDTLEGFGFVVPRTEKRKIMAATWTSRKFFHRTPEGKALVRCFLGGALNPDMVNLEDEKLVRYSLEELRNIVGLKAEPLKAWVFRWPFSMPQTVVGHEARMKRIERQVSSLDGLEITGGAYYGLGIPDCIHNAQLAAERLVKSF